MPLGDRDMALGLRAKEFVGLWVCRQIAAATEVVCPQGVDGLFGQGGLHPLADRSKELDGGAGHLVLRLLLLDSRSGPTT